MPYFEVVLRTTLNLKAAESSLRSQSAHFLGLVKVGHTQMPLQAALQFQCASARKQLRKTFCAQTCYETDAADQICAQLLAYCAAEILRCSRARGRNFAENHQKSVECSLRSPIHTIFGNFPKFLSRAHPENTTGMAKNP
mgnify:CR=1 FL=1